MSTFKFMPTNDLAIAQGSIILVTGVSGMIAIHIADEALKAGFRVRGTVRSKEKGQQAASLLNSPEFEFVIVEDMAANCAFDNAMKGVSAAIHCASIVNFSGIIDDVVPPTVKGSLNILDAALTNPGIRTVVFTSSSGAASGPRPGVGFHVGSDTWNEAAMDLIKNTPPQKQGEMGFDWGYMVYVASKIEAERAVWDFVEQRKPSFTVNVINPAMNWGKVMGSMGISGAHILSVLDGKVPNIPSGEFASHS
ncbi:hypothetical protein H634G_09927 [Metarhizium anisopliae BRIP 53293]|uniref:NAD-dependent epimerase/dehydratase domain-containing protein n=1 Tax=Metarhizium anisopliae BRIP 53293 TaxID=1291518 RepID=A0A0D9NM84_METAN|nr:hypothetical protein H634G_09927 [Metarhizium anisopliae BRIP 53293]KJK94809.1 hypothetical protein H633G_01319 [Metarhizium anisopliae BRIP 53284]